MAEVEPRQRFTKEPYEDLGRKSAYLNMVICHAIAQSDELTFGKFIRKMQIVAARKDADDAAKRTVKLLGDVPFREARQLVDRRDMRACMNDALSFAIETRRETIAFDLINFSNENAFAITFCEKAMQLMVKGDMFSLIEDLINAHAMFSITIA
jgi:hypothetical protein